METLRAISEEKLIRKAASHLATNFSVDDFGKYNKVDGTDNEIISSHVSIATSHSLLR